jgi:hypothetical protein
MSDRWLVLGAIGTIVAALVAAVAQADPRTERVSLAPNVPRVTAEGSLVRDELRISVTGVAAHVRVAASIDRLACAGTGAPAGHAVADAGGRARWTAPRAVDGALRDGRHVLAITVGRATIACGPLPSTRARSEPAPQGHWGVWSFARHFVD